MSIRSSVSVLVLALAIGAGVFAQSKPPLVAPREGDLLVYAEFVEVNSANKVSEECGPYIRFLKGVPKDKTNKKGTVRYAFGKVNTEGKALDVAMQEIGREKLEIHIAQGQKRPTTKVLRIGGRVYPWAVLTMSEEDFLKAPCLKDVKVIR